MRQSADLYRYGCGLLLQGWANYVTLSHGSISLYGSRHSPVKITYKHRQDNVLNETTVRFCGHFVSYIVCQIMQLYECILFLCIKSFIMQ